MSSLVPAILAGLVWLAAGHGLCAQTDFIQITTGPLVTDLGSSWTGVIVDYDGDGHLDVFVDRNPAPGFSGRSSLYHNDGNSTFSGVTNNLFPVAQREYAWGFWADFDNHNGPDLFMTDADGVLPSYFAFNNGDGSFTKVDFEVQSAWGISMVDYNQDGLLDLYLIAGKTNRENRLYRNLDGRSFQPITRDEVGDLLPLTPTYGSAAWADYDDDGRFDVFAASLANFNQCQMYHNEGNGRFASAINEVTFSGISGTTAAWGDYDNDGRVDLCIGALTETSYIYRNVGGGEFEQASIGVTLPQVRAVAWGDYDNDGFLDLLLTDNSSRGCGLFRNNGNGTFTRITSGPLVTNIPSGTWSYSANWFDYDNDGFLDVFVANGDDSGTVAVGNYLYHNEGNSNAWLKIKLVGAVSNRDAVGAKVRAQATFAGESRWQRRDMAAGDNFGGNNNPIAHFGLGDATNVETLRVEWPSGQVTELHNMSVRRSITIAEPPGFTRVTGPPWDTDLGACFNGVAGDYDGDEYLDLYVAPYKSGSSALYHNNRDGTFTSVTNGVFPLAAGPFFGGPWGDFDNDGQLDLFVMGQVIPAYFLFNNGDGTFANVPLATLDTWAANPVDYDHDGLLDLYITSGFTSPGNWLYRNLGDRVFQEMTSAEVGPIAGVYTLGAASWVDYDDDGWADVCAGAQFSNPNRVQMYRNIRGRFVAVTNVVTQDNLPCIVPCWGDYDNDGRVDLCVAAWSGGSRVYRNLGDGVFERADIGVALPAHYESASWADYDNDGFLDLLMFSGNQASTLLRNSGNGTFTQITTGPIITNRPGTDKSYTGLWFDYDNDGFLDLFVANGNDAGTALVPNFLFHNDGNANAWLKVKLVGTLSNRDGAGAKVRLKATFAGATRWQRRDIIAGGEPYVGSHNSIAHFGLGDATNVETLRVEWPSGQVTELHNLGVRQSLTITEAPGFRAFEPVPGTLQLQLTAHPGMNVGLAVSSNLVNWVPWQTVPQTNRTVIVTDPEVGQPPQRFYKARVQ